MPEAMTSPATHITLPALIRLQAEARTLRLPSARPANSRQAGLQHSPHKGRGMAFAEVRPYQAGDDIRSIDWRVTARRQTPHTKLYEEERERPLLLICDLGNSLYFGSVGAYKQVRCAQLAALLAWLGLWSGDQVGGIVFNDNRIDVLRPARRKKTVLRLLDNLAQFQHQPNDPLPARSTDAPAAIGLDTALQEARRVSHTGGRVFVLSDFLSVSDETPALLASLSQHNTVTALRITDPLEQALPDTGRFAVASPDGPLWFDAGDSRFQAAFSNRVGQHEQRLAHCFRRSAVDAQTVSTAENAAQSLKTLLGPRGQLR
ncbi:DUF58 domain-containing protein [Marinobacter sp. SS21]|uniref:DUF58 domain-containing protein n=1 Tax=Marinobacter sp. SS21 TaxID=2979460 RepID=UPI00232C74B4|nr:DUF58 domain-containing protein [Marinobacter sp. SS21]MDC0662122.1 DUF58 domain-containing protein [Marinobacter sp. SS21]